jgi:predicted NBD/HSP70 family sugar kinase
MITGCGSIAPETTANFVRKIDLSNFQVATARTARDINRRILLNLIRKHQPISRADLSRHSRLQRSTVSAITEQLIAERWVMEGAMGDTPRGRKPTFLHLNGERAGIIGVDIRPSETTVAVADLSMRFLVQENVRTGREPGRFIAELCQRLQRIQTAFPNILFEGVGVALPGRIDLATKRLVFAPNLGWRDVEIKQPLEKATGLSVHLENAANACALAEMWCGRHSERVRDLIAVTVSEGIGVGMFLNGQLVRGSTGLAGEFGHFPIEPDGPLCNCGNRGCLDVCASNKAAVRHFVELDAQNTGKKSGAVPDFETVLELAEQGNNAAIEALDRMARSLASGIAMLVTGLAPDVIVVVGEVTRAWDRLGAIIESEVARRLPTAAQTRIVPADARTQPRLRGTISLVMQEHFGAPQII